MTILQRVFVGILFSIFILAVGVVHAGEIKEVVSTSPSWATFTNEDGTGLYHEILREVFGLYDLPVRHDYAKSNRADELVRLQLADMMTCDDRPENSLVTGRFPMYENDFYAFFNKKNVGTWNGQESLRNKRLVAQPGYYYQDNFSVPVKLSEVMTGEQALTMVVMGRADFYIDDKTLVQQSMEKSETAFIEDEFTMEKVGRRSYFPLFNLSTERGRQIKKMYEDGMLKLHKAGKLKPIYEKWGYLYPNFDKF